jgi:hypothetical protein
VKPLAFVHSQAQVGNQHLDRDLLLTGKLDPDTVVVSAGEVEDLRARMQDALRGIEDKSTHLVFKDLRRLLFRCAALLISKAQVSWLVGCLALTDKSCSD